MHTAPMVFGQLPSGQPVHAYTLRNGAGLALTALDYGGIVTELHAPDARGVSSDITLGFNHLGPYLDRHPYFGALVGRVAGRLTGGRFSLDGREYALAVNNPPNHLHGGLHGFDRRLWRAEQRDAHTLALSYCSPDGEEGYPGTVDVAVTYRLTEANEWVIEYTATSDQPTPFCPTQHAYFHLGGEAAGFVGDHEVQIHADRTVANDEHLTLLPRWVDVAGTAADFRQPRRLGDVLGDLFQQHGSMYQLAGPAGALRAAARIHHPPSGRTLDVLTTEPCMQFYTGAHLDGTCVGKSGHPYLRHHGLCFECQGNPGALNQPAMGDVVLRPGQTYRQTTVYRFSASA